MSPLGLEPWFHPPLNSRKNVMASAEKLPFSWQAFESLPDLECLRLVLDALPDEEKESALEPGRAAGATNTRCSRCGEH